jgi:uncharacterized protein YjiS (DUF1127 family)
MALVETAFRHPAPSSLVRVLGQALARIVAARHQRRRRAALQSLLTAPDYLLDDMGISRSDIPRMLSEHSRR